MSELNYEQLDPGIRETVRFLRDHGFHTTDSGDGVTKPEDERVFHRPHVVSVVDPEVLVERANYLLWLLRSAGVDVDATGPDDDDKTASVEASYDPCTKTGLILLFCGDEQLRAGKARGAPPEGKP